MADTWSNAFGLNVAKADFKFNAAHMMMAHKVRERLHGHNYRASIKIQGSLGEDGYVIDFGVVKKHIRNICKSLDERFLVASHSTDLVAHTNKNQIELHCSDGAFFSFPKEDCAMLPIYNTSAEELCRYIAQRFVDEITISTLQERKVSYIEVSLMETPQQEVSYQVNVSK